MQETIEQLCQKVVDERGYLVIASQRLHRIGDVLETISNRRTKFEPLAGPVVVIAETTEEDMIAQEALMLARPLKSPDIMPYYYRVTAE